jgi:hypothetical protein
VVADAIFDLADQRVQVGASGHLMIGVELDSVGAAVAGAEHQIEQGRVTPG